MSNRVQKIDELIKRELGQIILRELDFSRDVLVTVTRVKTSADLRQAKVYIGVIPEDKIPEIIQMLNKWVYHLQQALNKRLNTRIVPRIKFVAEEETLKAARVEKLLEKIKNSK